MALSQSHTIHYLCVLTVLSLLSLLPGTSCQVSFTPDNFQITQSSNYVLSIFTSTSIPANAMMALYFPTDYSASDLHLGSPYLGYDPNNDQCPVSATCAGVGLLYGGFALIISGMFPSSALLNVYYTIYNVPNPAKAGTTQNYQVVVYLGSNVYYNSVVAGNNFIAKTITCTPQLTYSEIWSITPLTITLTAPSPTISTIQATFPSFWPNEQIVATVLTSTLYCFSTAVPTLSCTNQPQHLLFSGLTYASSIDLQIYQINNPSAAITAGPITLNSYDVSNSPLDTCTFSIPSSSFTTTLLRDAYTSVSDSSNDQLTVVLGFTIAVTSLPVDYVLITFPSALSLTGVVFVVQVGDNIVSPVITSFPNNSLSFAPFNITNQANLILTVKQISRPRTALVTSNFLIQTYRNNLYLMDSISCCSLTIAPRTSLLVSISLSDSKLLVSPVTYTFLLTTVAANLRTTDQIAIQFPVPYSLPSSLCSGLTLTAVISVNLKSPTCSVVRNRVVLSGFAIADYAFPQTFTITIGSLANPAKSPPAFSVYTMSSDLSILEWSGSVVTITPASLSLLTVNPSSGTTAHLNTVYSFQVGNTASLLANYQLVLGYPPQVPYLDKNALLCTVNASPCPCWATFTTFYTLHILIQTPINIISTVTVSGATNPYTLQPTSVFTCTILNAFGVTVESSPLANTATLTMTSPASFTYFYINTVACSLLTNCTASVDLVLPYSTTSAVITITFTNAAIANPTCTYPCSASGSTLTLSYTSAAASNFVTFTASNVLLGDYHNAAATATLSLPSSPSPSLFPSPSLSPSLASPSTPFGFTATQLISTYALSLSNYILAQPSVGTLSITTSLFTSTPAYFIITVPLEFGSSSRFLNVTPLVSGNIYTLTLGSLTNPVTQAYTPFMFTAYDSLGHPIATSAPVPAASFTLQCALPCATCVAAQCTSCYSTVPWITAHYLSGSQCVDHCSLGQYLNDGQCVPCDTNCSSCLMYGPANTNGNGSQCLTCPAYLLNSRCYTLCPANYYNNVAICSPCVAPCVVCSSLSLCTECSTPFLLYGNTCYATCPLSTYSNSTSCLACSSNCLTCSSIQCFLCASPYYLYLGGCLSQCPLPLLPSWLSTCEVCDCTSCSTYSYNCTSCSVSLVLFGGKCLSACPNGTYKSGQLCLQCASDCLLCTSTLDCLQCTNGLGVYRQASTSSCVSVCPNGSVLSLISSVFQCLPCAANCLTCQFFTDYCVSCLPTYSLLNHQCLSACPSHYFPFSTALSSLCLLCDPFCVNCIVDQPTNCTVCVPNYYIYNAYCYSQCPNGTYSVLNACFTCSALCRTCSNGTNCTSCQPGYVLLNRYCWLSCPSPYFSSGGACVSCGSQCVTCIHNSPTECSACSNPLSYHNAVTNECTTDCTPPYYRSGQTCVNCQSPCVTCDTISTVCASCSTDRYLLGGVCYLACPVGYYGSGGTCNTCAEYCQACKSLGCTSCVSYAYMYHRQCVLNCSIYPDLPATVLQYCTNCLTVPFCSTCSLSLCTACVNPYVNFQGSCLDRCPTNYTASSTASCQMSESYLAYLAELELFNEPVFPPFGFVGLYLILILSVSLYSRSRYGFTYHPGYCIALLSAVDSACLLYGLYYICTRYQGDYLYEQASMPVVLLGVSYILKMVAVAVFILWVLRIHYWPDLRYSEWRQKRNYQWVLLGVVAFGCRWHKLYISKIAGLELFGSGLVSVCKFYPQDAVNLWACLCDVLDVAAFWLVSTNVFPSYSVLFLLSFEVLVLKALMWFLVAFDLRKLDKGFFLGDEEIVKQKEEQFLKLQRVDTDELVKMIRVKSQIIGFAVDVPRWEQISVYNPEEYEDVPVVPLRRIEKCIEAGRFRKGVKISIQQKLLRFADTLKPLPKPSEACISGMIYWKPSKKVRVTQAVTQDESLLRILEEKEMEYRQELELVEEQSQGRGRRGEEEQSQGRRRREEELTIPYQTLDRFYEPGSKDLLVADVEGDTYNGLMNLNYARKKHLVGRGRERELNDHGMRVLYHQPKKKRESFMDRSTFD